MVKGIWSWIPLVGEKKYYIKAIIVYPNKNVRMKKVFGDVKTFDVTEEKQTRKYSIDTKAIYHFDGEPVSFYDSSKSSPVLIEVFEQKGVKPSMNAQEFQSIIESKAVAEMLEATRGTSWDIQFIATIISAVGVVILLLTSGTLQKLLPTGG